MQPLKNLYTDVIQPLFNLYINSHAHVYQQVNCCVNLITAIGWQYWNVTKLWYIRHIIGIIITNYKLNFGKKCNQVGFCICNI